MPLEATQDTAAGAKAFAEFFIKTIDWGYATTSGAYIRHYAQPTCKACLGFATTIEADHKAGHHYVGGRLTIRNVGIESGAPSSTSITVTVDGTSREVVTSKGRFVKGDTAYPSLRLSVSLTWVKRAWAVAGLAVLV